MNSETKSTATARPWAYELRVPHGSADGQYVIYDPQSDNGDVLAIVDPDDIRAELDDTEANAELIVRAVNSHDKLLAAAKALVEEYRYNGGTDADPYWKLKRPQPTAEVWALWEQLRAAIEEAEPLQP